MSYGGCYGTSPNATGFERAGGPLSALKDLTDAERERIRAAWIPRYRGLLRKLDALLGSVSDCVREIQDAKDQLAQAIGTRPFEGADSPDRTTEFLEEPQRSCLLTNWRRSRKQAGLF